MLGNLSGLALPRGGNLAALALKGGGGGGSFVESVSDLDVAIGSWTHQGSGVYYQTVSVSDMVDLSLCEFLGRYGDSQGMNEGADAIGSWSGDEVIQIEPIGTTSLKLWTTGNVGPSTSGKFKYRLRKYASGAAEVTHMQFTNLTAGDNNLTLAAINSPFNTRTYSYQENGLNSIQRGLMTLTTNTNLLFHIQSAARSTSQPFNVQIVDTKA